MVVTCMMTDWVRSKPWLGLLGNLSAAMATLCAFGVCIYAGIDFIGINLAAPFLMIGKPNPRCSFPYLKRSSRYRNRRHLRHAGSLAAHFHQNPSPGAHGTDVKRSRRLHHHHLSDRFLQFLDWHLQSVSVGYHLLYLLWRRYGVPLRLALDLFRRVCGHFRLLRTEESPFHSMRESTTSI